MLLTKWGTYNGKIDKIFGSSINAVVAYQRQVFLIEDSTVGRLTWQDLSSGAPVNMPVLSPGSFGDSVIVLQNLLSSTNTYLGLIDGNFSPGTKAAVEAFQKLLCLDIDSIVADRTWHYPSKIPH